MKPQPHNYGYEQQVAFVSSIPSTSKAHIFASGNVERQYWKTKTTERYSREHHVDDEQEYYTIPCPGLPCLGAAAFPWMGKA